MLLLSVISLGVFLFQQMAEERLEVWISVNQDGIVLNGSGCDQQIQNGFPPKYPIPEPISPER